MCVCVCVFLRTVEKKGHSLFHLQCPQGWRGGDAVSVVMRVTCRWAEERRNLNLCFFQADSFLLLSVTVGLFKGEGEDAEVAAELLYLVIKKTTTTLFYMS